MLENSPSLLPAGVNPAAVPQLAFSGFAPPTSSATYTPNQFFDVVLRDARSTGIVRAVGYVLRKTLGWSRPDGSPQEAEILTDYGHLITEAGISRAKIRESLDEAIELRFLNCVRTASPDTAGKSSVSSLYELRWDDEGDYTTKADDFEGFFSGEGNRTYIPNEFFDTLIPNENLAVIKVVGAIIRHTIGFQNRYGFRRQEVDYLSLSRLQKETGLARQSVLNALERAVAANFVHRLDAGLFASGRGSKVAVYAIKWQDSKSLSVAVAEPVAKPISKSPEPFSGLKCEPVHILDRTVSKRPVHNLDREPVHNLDRTGSQFRPVKMKHLNETINNNSNGTSKAVIHHELESDGVVALLGALKERLCAFGVSSRQAGKLVQTYTEIQIVDQLDALEFRISTGQASKPENPGGFLVQAIREGFSSPKGFKTRAKTAKDAAEKQQKEQNRAKAAHEKKALEETKRVAEEDRQKADQQAVAKFLSVLPDDKQESIEKAALSTWTLTSTPGPSIRQALIHNHVMGLIKKNATEKNAGILSKMEESFPFGTTPRLREQSVCSGMEPQSATA